MVEAKPVRDIGSPHVVNDDLSRIHEFGALAAECARFAYQESDSYEKLALDGSPHIAEKHQADSTIAANGDHWPPEVFGTLTTSIWTYVSAAAEQLDGLAVLYEAGACLHPPFPVARAAYELSARAFWLLDPATSLSERVARMQLDAMASLEFQIQGTPKNQSDDMNESRAEAKRSLKLLRETLIPELLGTIEVDDDKPLASPHIAIAGERYLGPTETARYFQHQYSGPSESSWTTYDLLCLGTHPNAIFALSNAQAHVSDGGNSGLRFVVSAGSLSNILAIALQPYISAIGALWSWYGWDQGPLVSLCSRINEQLGPVVPEDWGGGAA